MTENQIECISLSKLYSRNHKIIKGVEDINLRISHNEMVIIKGRSGAGKSTLLNLMCGLIRPTNGKVIIGDSCITELSDDVLSDLLLNKIGIIFQNFNLLPTYTIYENIEIGVVPKELSRRIVEENIMSLLEQFGLKDTSHLLPSELSVGQQQKVAIVRTLVKHPSIIFADEPTGSLDEETAAEIIEHLINLNKEKRVTLVIATHGNAIEKYADKVFIIEKGQIR